MPTILQPSDYPAVRAAIDISLDSTLLPDATISLPIYLDAADLDVKRRDPEWATRTGDALTHLTNAAIYLTAARLVPALPDLTRETFTDHEYVRQARNIEQMVADLEAKAADELEALDPTTVVEMPTMFVTAPAFPRNRRP